jgi:hypothetical protein
VDRWFVLLKKERNVSINFSINIYMFLTSQSILQTKLTVPVVWSTLYIYLHVSNLTINFTNKTDCSGSLVNSIYIYLHVSNLTINITNKTDCSSSLVNSIYIFTCFYPHDQFYKQTDCSSSLVNSIYIFTCF